MKANRASACCSQHCCFFFFKSVKELAFCSEAANYRKWKQRSRLWTAFNFLPRCSPNGKREQDTFGLSLLKKITLLWRSFWLFFLNAAGVLGRFLTHVWCTSIALTIYCWDSSIRAADKLLSCQLSMCAFILKKSKGLLVFAHESFTKISPLKDFRFNHKSACSERSLLLIQLKGMLIHVPECVGRSAFLVQRCRVWHVCWKPVSLSPSCQVDCLFYTLVLRMFLISFMEMKWCALDNTGWL